MKTIKQYISSECGGNISEAARQLNTSYVTIHRWINGDCAPSRAWVKLLSERGIDGKCSKRKSVADAKQETLKKSCGVKNALTRSEKLTKKSITT